MIEWFVRKRKITLLFFIMVVILGLLSFFQLHKQEQPDVTVTTAMVTTAYPGASPEKVEQTITKKLEEKINELQGIKSIQSYSTFGMSTIVIQLQNGVDPKGKWQELRQKVQDSETNLPTDAKQPVIQDDLSRSFVQTLDVYADSFAQLYSLHDVLKSWKDQLRTIPHVSDVTIDGLPDKQVQVLIDTQKLQQYNISVDQVYAAIQKENDRVPLGEQQVNDRTYELHLNEVKDVNQFADTIITRSKLGQPVYLKDIGSVQMGVERAKQFVYYNGKPAVAISIQAENGADIPSLQQNVDQMMAFLAKDKPTWLHVQPIYSQNGRVHELFQELQQELLIAIVSVVFVCVLGLNLITAIVVALAIPISIAVGMIPLPYFGITLNQISIVGVIIVLGILVDDAVVVNDNIERRLYMLKESPFDAAVRGSKEVAVSILTATLATISSFGPLFFLQGDTGEFIRAVPVIITLSMLASMAMALTIIPIFRQWYESKRKGTADSYRKPAGLLGRQIQVLTQLYAQKIMPTLLQRPFLTALTGILLSLSAYALIPFTPIQLFPSANRAEMYVNIQAPVGSNIEATRKLVQNVGKWLESKGVVKYVSAYAGMDAPKMFMGDTSNGGGERGGQIVFALDTKKVTSSQILAPWNEELKKRFPGSLVTVKELQEGPPVGSPVEIRIYGEDLTTLRSLSEQVKQIVASVPGTKNISDSFGIEKNTLEFHLNKPMMDQLMVNTDDVSRMIRLISDGLTISQFDDGKDLVDIVMKMKPEAVDPTGMFRGLTVTNALGQQIPLTQLVTVGPGFAVNTIPHRNLSREVTINADIEKGLTATAVMQQLQPKLAAIKLPGGYRFETGGEISDQSEVFIDMGKLSIVVVFLILLLIAIQFYSLSIPILVLSTIYLATAGSLIGLFVTKSPLGFMAMMGVISLSGIVVRNGIVLVEFIEQARKRGIPLHEAVIRSGEARLRPILLTTATAISGLAPMALFGDVLFRPLAVTIIFGLAYSTMLTLIIVPSLYTVIAKRKEHKQHKKDSKLQGQTLNMHM